MWHLTACKISVSLSFLNWIKSEMTFYRISANIIQKYDKNHFIFATFYEFINTIYLFIKLFLDNEMSNFGEYLEPINTPGY